MVRTGGLLMPIDKAHRHYTSCTTPRVEGRVFSRPQRTHPRNCILLEDPVCFRNAKMVPNVA